MKIALDTNAYRKLGEGDEAVLEHVQTCDVVALPVPVLGELRAGFAVGSRQRHNDAMLRRFLDGPRVEVVPCDEQTTHFYGELRAQLRRQGTPIPVNDVWIAAIVLQHRLRLLTFDSDFDHIAQLPRV